MKLEQFYCLNGVKNDVGVMVGVWSRIWNLFNNWEIMNQILFVHEHRSAKENNAEGGLIFIIV